MHEEYIKLLETKLATCEGCTKSPDCAYKNVNLRKLARLKEAQKRATEAQKDGKD